MSYDLGPVRAPRLTGTPLVMLAALLESRWIRPLLAPKLLRDLGIGRLRNQVSAAPPTLHPYIPADDEARRASAVTLAGVDQVAAQLSSSPWPSSSARASLPGVADFARAYRDGKAGPEGVAESVLRAIRDSNDLRRPPLRAIIACDEADVRAQARASAERWRRGRPLSVFDGVPVAVKDEIDQTPYRTTVGTRVLGRRPASEDATAVARLRAAGALLIGKANMHEIGVGVTGMNPNTGFARNPWNPEHATGGSSSGPAAAVAAGLCPVAVGADGGGSIRIPAALCGGVGLKPTFGRVSLRGAFPTCFSVGHLGPIANSALDCALAYAVMAGPDPADEWSRGGPPVHLDGLGNSDLSGVRIGLYRPWFDHATPDIVAAAAAVLETLQARGASLVPIEIPDLDAVRVAHGITIVAEMADSMDTHLGARRSALSAESRINLALATTLTTQDFLRSQSIRTQAIAHMQEAFAQVDVIITPTTACSAPLIRPDALKYGESNLPVLTELMRFAVLANFTGVPAISFPAGFDRDGLPVGVQLMGRWWQEHLLLRMARAAETAVESRLPAVFYPLLGA